MAGQNWRKNKKGVLVNSEGKTSLEVRLDKYAAKLKARKEKLAAKKAAKASSGGGGEQATKKRMTLEERRQQPEFAVGSAKGAAKKELRQELKRLDQEKRKEYEPIDAKLKARQQKEGISDGKLTGSNAFKQWNKEASKIEDKYLPLKDEANARYQKKKEALDNLGSLLNKKSSAKTISEATKKVQEQIPGFKLDAQKSAQKSAQNATEKAARKSAQKDARKAAREEKMAQKAKAAEEKMAQKATATEQKPPRAKKESASSQAAKDKVMGQGGLSVGQLRKSIADYFNEKDAKDLPNNDMYQMGTRMMKQEWENKNPGKKWDLNNPDVLETMYRKYVDILPKERNSTGPTSINGIDVTKYFRPYQVFGLDPKTATKEDKKRAYRKLAQKYHPDNQETGDRDMFEQIENMYKSITVEIAKSPKSKGKGKGKKNQSPTGPLLLPPAR